MRGPGVVDSETSRLALWRVPPEAFTFTGYARKPFTDRVIGL